MAKGPPNLFVSARGQTAWIKVTGRGNFTSSVVFKNLVHELRERGFQKFILELSECVTMDSTFLGVLAGSALRFSAEGQGATLELLRPNARVLDLLENLGVAHLFTVLSEAPPGPEASEVAVADQDATREELSQTVLDAHRTLMDIHPDNIPKFKDVAQFLADEIRKSDS